MAASYCVFPLAGSATGLALVRVLYAVGMVASTLMMVTCVAEYTQDATRGRWMGMIGVCNGLGVVLMTAGLARLPDWFSQRGFSSAESIRYTFWAFAVGLLLLAVFLRLGLKGHSPNATRQELTLFQRLAIGATAARDNPRIALAYLLAFASRGDLLIIVTFTFLWVIQAGQDAGLSPAAATAKAGMIFGISQGIALLWSIAMGTILDRVPRLTGVSLAFALAGIGYTVLGQVDNPLGPWMIPAAILAGIGEASAVVASGVLIGQEAPAATRGTLIGVFGLCGSLGIVSLTYAGGKVFDSIGPHAPFVMMGVVNSAVFGVALWVRNKTTAQIPQAASTTGAAGYVD
jgi:MFS family permease